MRHNIICHVTLYYVLCYIRYYITLYVINVILCYVLQVTYILLHYVTFCYHHVACSYCRLRYKFLFRCINVDGSPCDKSNFVTKLTEYGPCYVYNNDNKIMANKGGISSSLTLYINLEAYQAMPGPSDLSSLKVLKVKITKVCSITRCCVQISIYNDDVEPDITMNSIDAPPGYMSFIGLNYHEVKNALI